MQKMNQDIDLQENRIFLAIGRNGHNSDYDIDLQLFLTWTMMEMPMKLFLTESKDAE
jgi:hypothetical protein